MAPMCDAELVAHCEALEREMTAQRDALQTDLFFRALEEAKDRLGHQVTDGDDRAAIHRTAQAQATEIVMREQVYDLLNDPTVSPMVEGPWGESLPDLEVAWHPDWAELIDLPWTWNELLDPAEFEAQGLLADDPWTWWRAFPPPPGVTACFDAAEINQALDDGRLVWVDREVVPRLRLERLAAEADGAPKHQER
jgi:hypothetical protein